VIKETELNLFVPAPELLVRLASGDHPLGISAGPPRIRLLRETYFDTKEETLRRRGMTCKLRQGEGEDPSVVVTVGEGPDSEGITSRSRLTASAVGMGIFETLREDSEVAAQIQKFVDPRDLRPQIALDIQRLGRVHRRGFFRLPVLYLLFDRITVQAGGSTSLLHELRIRRRRPGGPLIRELGQALRDQHDLFPDGQSTLQRAYRVLSLERKGPESTLSPYALSLALVLFREGRLGLIQRGDLLCIPTFRGSGEDAARALAADLTGSEELELDRLGATEPREGRPVVEVWVAPNPPEGKTEDRESGGLVWYPWHALLEMAGRGGIRDPNLLSALLLLTRHRLLGKLKWIPDHGSPEDISPKESPTGYLPVGREATEPELQAVEALLPFLRAAERTTASLENRLRAVTDFSSGMDEVFNRQVAELKGRILGSKLETKDTEPVFLLDLLSVRIRGLLDRLYHVVKEDLLPGLEARDIYLKDWAGLMREDRRALLEDFSSRYLPDLHVVADWGPAFVPEMPPGGCALGLTARVKGTEATRFFHVVLGESTPSFLRVPGSSVALSLEEVIRGFLFSRHPELELTESFIFRFRTAEVTIWETTRDPIVTPAPGTPAPEPPQDALSPDASPQPPEVTIRERVESVVTQVMAHQRMSESHQAQLLRALERQVTRRSPLIGWSDMYTVDGPMDLTGLVDLLKLGEGT
jgi:hypothetical protein